MDESVALPEGFAGLFSGVAQHENFPRFAEAMPSNAMAASPQSLPFAVDSPIELPESFTFASEARATAAFLDSTDTAALLVVKDGTIRFEDYWLTGGPDVPWISFSVAKSFLSALIGIAIGDGYIGSVEDIMTDYAPSLAGSAYDNVRIKDVLQMSSGARWNEDYSDPTSDVFRLGAAVGGGSLDEFVAAMSREFEPGTVCRYNSADTQALGLILANAIGQSITDYTVEKLWHPLGMESAGAWLLDSADREMVFAGLMSTARDFAKLGELYRNGGLVNGVQVVPANWVAASVTPDAPHIMPGVVELSEDPAPVGYGYQWWIPGGDRGEFAAIGVYNQFIYVDPSRNVVVVKLSANRAYGTTVFERDNREAETIEFLRAVAGEFD